MNLSKTTQQMNLLYNKHGPGFDAGLPVNARPRDGTAKRPRDGTEAMSRDGTGRRPRDGTEELCRDGTARRPRDGTEESSRDGTERRPRDGTEELCRDGTARRPRDGTEERSCGINARKPRDKIMLQQELIPSSKRRTTRRGKPAFRTGNGRGTPRKEIQNGKCKVKIQNKKKNASSSHNDN